MRNIVYTNINLAPFTWLKVGGTPKYLAVPSNTAELQQVIRDYGMLINNIRCIGACSNTIITENIGNFLIIRSNFMNNISVHENQITCGSGVLSIQASKYALKHFLTGMEFLYTIPGSIGGNIRMNAGCYGQEIENILLSVIVVNKNGEVYELKNSDLKFAYRHSEITSDMFITEATFQLQKGSYETINNLIIENSTKRAKTQPTSGKTCGSTFKNPEGQSAWKLIKESEAHLLEYNGVCFSKKHCNFIINNSKHSNDVITFIEKVKEIVLKKTNVQLELELHII